jgi:ATP/maltotriose-dependent transcriptional regulator MalT
MSLIARAHLLRGEWAQAQDTLSECMNLVQQQRWLAFLPWPQALEAELNLNMGKVDEAAETLEHAWMLACQLNDPCWEGMVARGLGLVNADRGDEDKATNWLGEAARRCNRVSDRYQWVRAYVMDAAIATAIEQDDSLRARPLISTLSTVAARCSMDEFLVRAQVHQFRTGDTPAAPTLTTAFGLAAQIDNPALDELMATMPRE